MIRSARALALATAVALVAAGCAKPAFTRGVRDQFGFSNADLSRIQFYTSEEIVLSREVGAQRKEMTGHGLVVRDGVRFEEVVIPARTPGVVMRVEGDYLLVAFARDRQDRALWFALDSTVPAEVPPEQRRYRLAELENAPTESPPFSPRPSTGFLVTWGEGRFRVASGRTAYLLYDLDTSFRREQVRETAPGWRLGEGQPTVLPAAAPAASAPPATPR